jgi:uncharacterized protein (TIGR03083 family)
VATESPWPTINAERAALVADLQALSDEQWLTPSLCPGWSVRQVLGHLTATATMTPPKFFAKFAAAGFRFHDMSDRDVARQTAGTPAQQLAAFSAQVGATTHPPGPRDAMLGEIVVHGEDIRRPLGISHAYPVAAVTRAADFYQASNLLIGSKARIAGVTLRATDADWSMGSGPEAAGPALSLLLAMTGRSAALDDLSGPGVSILRTRD